MAEAVVRNRTCVREDYRLHSIIVSRVFRRSQRHLWAARTRIVVTTAAVVI